MNDPTEVNNYIYKNGESLLFQASYSQKGLGVIMSAKRTDNMGYKSKRTETSNSLDINYLPALTRQHTYSFVCYVSLCYPAQWRNGSSGQINYKIKKAQKLAVNTEQILL